MDPRQLLISEWPTVENLIAATSRKRKLQEGEVEELASHVKIKLFEDDCAVIRNFRGESKLSTYLHVMVDRAALDIYIRRIGKWHPSASAKRLGPLAMELERLIYRSGCTVEEAMATIRREQPDVTVDVLNEILLRIPQRKVRDGRAVPIEAVEQSLCDDEDADILVIAEERRKVSVRAAAVIRKHLSKFDDTDRLVFQLRFESDLRLADIARMLGLDQGRLYRRHHELLRNLRTAMESDRITAEEIADLIGHISEEFDFGLRKPELRPSETTGGVEVRGEIQK